MATKAANPAAKAETVSTRNLAVQLAEKHEMSNKQAVLVLDDVIGLITKHVFIGDPLY